jgi:hypothetical protein
LVIARFQHLEGAGETRRDVDGLAHAGFLKTAGVAVHTAAAFEHGEHFLLAGPMAMRQWPTWLRHRPE